MTDVDVHGPIDVVLMEFPTDGIDGRVAAEIAALEDAGIVHVYDLLVISKDGDGSVLEVELADVGDGAMAAFAHLATGMLDEDDIAMAAAAMEPGTLAALLVYENRWAVPLVAAARAAGGELIASERIPADVVTAALDALEN